MYHSILAFLTALLAGAESEPQPSQGVRVMSVEQRLIVRVPVRPRVNGRLRWEEANYGPKCLPVQAVAGASLAGNDGIDFVLQGRKRVRAKLDSECDGLDFWEGFYIQPEDRRICAGRDTIRSRVGGVCGISKFRMLVPHLDRGE